VVLAAIASAVLLALAVWWWRQRRATLLEQVGYAFAVGGALGNVADRIGRGYVIDFMHLERWPVFNVADVAVVVGMGLLVIANRDQLTTRRTLRAAGD
jgi:signal peptidase II